MQYILTQEELNELKHRGDLRAKKDIEEFKQLCKEAKKLLPNLPRIREYNQLDFGAPTERKDPRYEFVEIFLKKMADKEWDDTNND